MHLQSIYSHVTNGIRHYSYYYTFGKYTETLTDIIIDTKNTFTKHTTQLCLD